MQGVALFNGVLAPSLGKIAIRMTSRPQRKTIRLARSAYARGNAFFITVATYERHPWFHVHFRLAQVAKEELARLAVARGAEIYAWCLMPDHLHMLLQDSDIVAFVRIFKGRLAAAARGFERGRRLWQRSFFDHGLRNNETMEDICRYIWENPVRKGLAESAADYPWSGGMWLDRAYA